MFGLARIVLVGGLAAVVGIGCGAAGSGGGGGGGGDTPPPGRTANALVESRFRSDNEGWTLDGRNPFWSPTGGRVGGHIFFLNERGAVRLWDAPPKFLGDQSAAAGGLLTFSVSVDVPGSLGVSVGPVLVRLAGAGKSMVVAPTQRLERRTWMAFSLRLDTSQGWALEGGGGAATNADIEEILGSLSQFQINADWDLNGNVSNTRLDEVALVAP